VQSNCEDVTPISSRDRRWLVDCFQQPPNLFHTTLHFPPFLFIFNFYKIHSSRYACLVCHLSFPKINSFLLIKLYRLYKLYRLKSPLNIKSFHLGLIGLNSFQKSPSIQLCYQDYFKYHITHPSQHFFIIINNFLYNIYDMAIPCGKQMVTWTHD
jgi:hypothetical protein